VSALAQVKDLLIVKKEKADYLLDKYSFKEVSNE
jgi:hypothetical protein